MKSMQRQSRLHALMVLPLGQRVALMVSIMGAGGGTGGDFPILQPCPISWKSWDIHGDLWISMEIQINP